jgi:quercetin dioxygenase-like cupin family protein
MQSTDGARPHNGLDGSGVFVRSRDVVWERPDEGIRRQILAYDGGLMLVRVLFEKGAVGQPHAHPHRQATYVESGAFEVEIGGEKAVLRAGDGFFVPPDALHGAVALEDGCLIDVFTPARGAFLGTDDDFAFDDDGLVRLDGRGRPVGGDGGTSGA